MLYFLLLFFWVGIALQTKQWLIAGLAVFFIFLLLFIYRKQPDEDFKKVKLLPSKVILLLSFWGCGLICLNAYAQMPCLSCVQSFLSRALNNIYDLSLKGLIREHMRFCVMFGFALLWLIFSVALRGKKC